MPSKEKDKPTGWQRFWQILVGITVILGGLGAISEMTGNPVFPRHKKDCIMPNIVNEPEPAARIELGKVTDDIVVKYITGTSVEAGVVLKQYPKAGQYLEGCNTEVYLEISADQSTTYSTTRNRPDAGKPAGKNSWTWVFIVLGVFLIFKIFGDWL